MYPWPIVARWFLCLTAACFLDLGLGLRVRVKVRVKVMVRVKG